MRSTLMNALIHPIHIATLIIAAISGLIAAWRLFPLGILIWLGMVLQFVNNPTEKFRQKIDERQPLAGRFDPPFRQIQRIQVQMFNSINASTAENRKSLQAIMDGMNTLVEEVYQLCLRMTPVENFRIVTEPITTLEQQSKQLSAQIEQTADPIAKNAYEEAHQALTLRIEQQNRTLAQLSRIDAYLSGLTSELNTILAQVIPLQAMRNDVTQQKAPAVVTRIEQEIAEIREFNES